MSTEPTVSTRDVAVPATAEPVWQSLRACTPARIGLGRSGDTLPLRPVLDFQLAHAQARDAVHAALDVESLQAALAPAETVVVKSAAPDRAAYLRRPDLGRSLSSPSHDALRDRCSDGIDCVFVVADGLSATAVTQHAAPLLATCWPRLRHLALGPVVIATQARVALGDSIGALLRARLSVVLIGERPGLSVADSLGAYITFNPAPGRRDSERNCISNIHRAGGLGYPEAADMLCWLIDTALARQVTGTSLKVGAEVAQLE